MVSFKPARPTWMALQASRNVQSHPGSRSPIVSVQSSMVSKLSSSRFYSVSSDVSTGTSWWHSHLSGQYLNGLVGPIVVHGPKSDHDYDIDIGPVMLTDWYHDYYINLLEQIYHAGLNASTPPPMANNMVDLHENHGP